MIPVVKRAHFHFLSTFGVLLLWALIGFLNHTTAQVHNSTVSPDFIRNFFGAVHLNKEHHPYADQVGASWGRVGIKWDIHEPAPGQYQFSSYDSLVHSARRHNIRILPVINHSAAWASSAPDSITRNRRMYAPSPAHTDDWKAYVEQIVTRYPEIEYFEVWNEPNIDWFLRADTNYKVYVDSILIPAAKVIHRHGRKVVGPSFTTEWPLDSWPPGDRPRKHSENVASNIRAMNRWLSYHQAWKYIDILSIHYTHGDTDKPSYPYADNMMPFYDYIYEKWIEPGKIDGIWNTEEGFAGTEAGLQGFVALDRWEVNPLAQWAARYTVPVLHWALRHNWHFSNQYKVFWYHMAAGDHPRSLLKHKEDTLVPSPTGRVLQTTRNLLTSGRPISTYSDPIRVGFGIHATDTSAFNYFPPYEFTTYGFEVGEDIVIAAWVDLPHSDAFHQPIQATVDGLSPNTEYIIHSVDYISGRQTREGKKYSSENGQLSFTLSPTDQPVLYLRLQKSP